MKKNKLPKNWKEVELGDCSYFEVLGSGIDNFNGNKEFLSTKCIKYDKIKEIECEITFGDRPSRANMQPVLNSVWFAKMQGTIKTYLFSEPNKEEIDKYILSTGFSGIRLSNVIDSKYIQLYFLSKEFNKNKDKECIGGTQKAINNTKIKKIKIPLPFTPEGKPDLKKQKQIARILEDAEKLKDKNKVTIEALDEYLKSVFNEMFGHPIYNEKEWEVSELNDLGVWKSGGTPSRANKEYFTGNIPWYTTGELNSLYIGESREKITEEAINKSGAKILKKNMLLLGMYDTAALKSSITTRRSSCNQAVVFSELENKNSEIFYVYHAIQIGKKHYLSQQRGVRQKNLNLSIVKSLKIPLPPLPLQEKFAAIVKEVEEIKKKFKEK